MSITKTIAQRATTALPVTAAAPRVVIPSITRQVPRAFSTTRPDQKAVTDAVKDGLKKADRVVSDTIVDGIDIGCRSFP